MRSPGPALFAVTILVFLQWTAGCANPTPQLPRQSQPAATRARIFIGGTPGAAFSGFYVVEGTRSRLAGRVPLTLDIPGISQVAIAKQNAADALDIQVEYERGSGTMTSPPGRSDALLVVVQGGFSGSYIPAEKLSAMGENPLIVIKPYWYEGTWVFDDEQTGLHREPFVSGVPEMINEVVKDIPNARQGFRLTCSEHEFPGFQKKLIWVRAELGGNYYRLDGTGMQGWLCPAMFRYFSHAPGTLFVKVDAITP
jgi:hypothetical protein